MIGTRIGSYILRQKIGEGGMGAVYLAEHELLGTKRVVKVLLPQWVQNAEVVQRFVNEAKAAARLEHSNIISVDDCGQFADGQWFILMPFLDGKSLEDFLRERQVLTMHQAVSVLAQVCNGLRKAHEAGIVHRDLKPANIFLTHSDALPDSFPYHVTILDFGIAKLAEADGRGLTKTGAAFGTPAFMAPEQSEDASRADPLSDVYALGVIAYQLVTGELPFHAPTAPMIYHAQITSTPADPRWKNATVAEAFARVILSALSPRPAGRPQSAQAFALALAEATPAAPPFEPSGLDIVGQVARKLLVDAAPSDATVRNPSGQHGVPSRGPLGGHSSQPLGTVPMPPSSVPGFGDVLGNSRPQATLSSVVPMSPHTTLGSASGQSSGPSPQPKGRRLVGRWPLLALGGVAVTGGAIAFTLAGQMSSDRHPAGGGVSPAPMAPDASVDPPLDAALLPPEPPDSTTSVVTVVTVPEGATVLVDGEPRGVSPLNLELPRGAKVVVRSEFEGYAAYGSFVDVGDKPVLVRHELDALPTEAPKGSSSKLKSKGSSSKGPPSKPTSSNGSSSSSKPTKPDDTPQGPKDRPGYNPDDVGGD